MMATRRQIIVTSGRMWVLNRTACASPKERITSRLSWIWPGSSPIVGSSSSSTSGVPSRAWASPTRCRYPFESL